MMRGDGEGGTWSPIVQPDNIYIQANEARASRPDLALSYLQGQETPSAVYRGLRCYSYILGTQSNLGYESGCIPRGFQGLRGNPIGIPAVVGLVYARSCIVQRMDQMGRGRQNIDRTPELEGANLSQVVNSRHHGKE
jgi:hypothetical protein